MTTFDAELRGSSLTWAVLVPPLLYWTLVQVFAMQAGDGVMPLGRLALLIALAQALPLAALAWMLASTAAYSVRPGRLVRHSVLRDREYALGPDAELAAREDGSILVRWPEQSLCLRVKNAAECLERLRDAVGPPRQEEARWQGHQAS